MKISILGLLNAVALNAVFAALLIHNEQYALIAVSCLLPITIYWVYSYRQELKEDNE